MSKKVGLLAASTIVLLIFLSNLTVIGHTMAAEYLSNFERIPAIDNRPPQVAIWKRTPTIIVCEYAPINEDAIKKALKFWEALGYNFFTTQYKYDPLDKCKSKAPVGYILIHLITQGIKLDDDFLAETHFYVDNDHNEIEWAIIYMRSEIKETVLEHEMGHALGFLHFNRINHLMNAKWTQGGWDKNGLQNRRR